MSADERGRAAVVRRPAGDGTAPPPRTPPCGLGKVSLSGWLIVFWQKVGFRLNWHRLGRTWVHSTQNRLGNPKKKRVKRVKNAKNTFATLLSWILIVSGILRNAKTCGNGTASNKFLENCRKFLNDL